MTKNTDKLSDQLVCALTERQRQDINAGLTTASPVRFRWPIIQTGERQAHVLVPTGDDAPIRVAVDIDKCTKHRISDEEIETAYRRATEVIVESLLIVRS